MHYLLTLTVRPVRPDGLSDRWSFRWSFFSNYSFHHKIWKIGRRNITCTLFCVSFNGFALRHTVGLIHKESYFMTHISWSQRNHICHKIIKYHFARILVTFSIWCSRPVQSHVKQSSDIFLKFSQNSFCSVLSKWALEQKNSKNIFRKFSEI